MKNRVGIIGPEDLVHKATKLMDSYPMLQGIPLPYGSEQEAVGMVKRHYHEADLFLFTGYVPYKLVLNENLDIVETSTCSFTFLSQVLV